MAIPSRSQQKAFLRQEARKTIEAIPQKQQSAWSKAICQIIGVWLESRPSFRKIALFAALPGEPELAPLFDQDLERDYYYPLVRSGDELSFHLISDVSSLLPGSYKIREPNPEIHPVASVADFDLILCPGLAYGENGSRLGRGKGFYDRALALASESARIAGVCFSSQCLPSVPCEPHDIHMHFLLTEQGCLEINTRPEGAA